MSETLVVAEPGGWLAEYQRERCNGATQLTSYQGMLADEIVLPQSAATAKDPALLVNAATAWVEAMLGQALFIPGEFAPEALWSFYVSDYVTQAKAAGHAQYFMLRGGDEIALRCVSSGLKSMVADPHLDLFALMVRLKRAKPQAAKKVAAQKGYRNVAAALADLDKKLAELETKEPLMPRHKTWLKSLRKVKLVEDDEVAQSVARLAALNPLRAPRKGESDRLRAEQQRADPAFQSASSLCEMAGLRLTGLGRSGFVQMRTIWPEGPDRTGFAYRVETDHGPRAGMFYVEGGLFKRRLAVLIERGAPLPLGSLSLTRGDYAAIVPAPAKGS